MQHLPGYCVLITDTPGVDQLIDLAPDRQLLFLEDMAILGRAVAEVCAKRDPQFRRINLEIQGNTDAFLHAHVTPRYEWEPPEIVGLAGGAAPLDEADDRPGRPRRSAPSTTDSDASSARRSTARLALAGFG